MRTFSSFHAAGFNMDEELVKYIYVCVRVFVYVCVCVCVTIYY